MILYRYLTREIFTNTLAVASVLLLVIVGSRFAKFLSNAASGKVSLEALGWLTLYYMPYALQLILPLSFILALMLSFGRWYIESEMPVIQAAGVSQRQLLKLTLVLALAIASLTAVGSFYLTPKALYASAKLMEEERQKTGFEQLAPGQFAKLGKQSVFIDSLSEDKQKLSKVLIAHQQEGKSFLALANSGFQEISPSSKSKFLVLEDGWRYQLPQEDLTSNNLKFASYALRLSTYTPPTIREQLALLPLNQLLKQNSLAASLELQWRLSLPLIPLVMLLIALPLTKVSPRQGRFLALLPVIFLQFVYFGLITASQGNIAKGNWPLWPGLWLIHAVFLSLGLGLSYLRGVFHK